MRQTILTCSIIFFITTISFSQQGLIKSFYNNGDTLKSEINYSNNIREGSAKFYYPNGKLKEELTYANGKVEGLVKEYYDNGKMKVMFNVESGKREGPTSLFDSTGRYIKDIIYNNGMLVPDENPVVTDSVSTDSTKVEEENGKNINNQKVASLKEKAAETPVPPSYKENNDTTGSSYLLTAEIMPEPVGGMQAIMKKLVYPEYARKNNIQGTVEIKAFIDRYGEVTNAEVVKGIGYGCDESAKIAVFYAKFRPGIIKGKPVKVQMILPIEFRLNKK